MDSMQPCERIILPLDVSDINLAADLVNQLSPYVGIFKVGLEMIYSTMADLILFDFLKTRSHLLNVRQLANTIGDKTFLDVKLSDIPNTVDRASKAIVRLKPKMFNVHASSGRVAMTEAAKHKGNSKLLAVTVLTSLSYGDVLELWYPRDEPYEIPTPDPDNIGNAGKMRKIVLQMTWAAYEAGADGVVCSPQELAELSTHEGFRNLMKVTPGIRPSWASANDQKRVMTPTEAIKAGATALVIGRPITNPPKEIGTPADAAKRIFDEIAGAL